jgi:hypothetical protein
MTFGLIRRPSISRPAARVRVSRCLRLIDKLLQRCFLGFAQSDNTLRPLPRHHGGAKLVKFKRSYQEHLFDLLMPVEKLLAIRKCGVIPRSPKNPSTEGAWSSDHRQS